MYVTSVWYANIKKGKLSRTATCPAKTSQRCVFMGSLTFFPLLRPKYDWEGLSIEQNLMGTVVFPLSLPLLLIGRVHHNTRYSIYTASYSVVGGRVAARVVLSTKIDYDSLRRVG